MALSLCRVLGVALYFSEGFSEAAARVSTVAEVLQSLEETVNRDDLEEGFLADKTTGNGFVLFWEAVVRLEMKAFPCFWE